MPARGEIQTEILNAKTTAQDTIRRKYLKALSKYTGRDTIIYASAFTARKVPHTPNYTLTITLEDLQGFMASLERLEGDELDLILHSPGGSLEAADQIVQYLRSKYKHIRAIVPQNAMSAATMIACACDEIILGNHSALGPIDPQITFPTQTGQFTAPAQAILDEFEQAKKEILENQDLAPLWVGKIRDYPPGLLNVCRNTLNLAIDKVTEWLSNYMFKNQADGQEKARRVAEWLGDAREHKTHARPIGVDQAEAIGLRISRFEADRHFQELVLSVFHATAVTLEITDCIKFIDNQNGKGWFLMAQAK